jgi:hypothetical protein
MLVMRILTGLTITLLLSALSLGAACEISCSFAQSGSDCHSLLAMNPNSDHVGAQMLGMEMSMDGMSMPSMAIGGSQVFVSALSVHQSGHPMIGEIGLCEGHSCDDRPVASVRSARSYFPQFHAALLAANSSLVSVLPTLAYRGGDDVSPHQPRGGSPPVLSLRI